MRWKKMWKKTSPDLLLCSLKSYIVPTTESSVWDRKYPPTRENF